MATNPSMYMNLPIPVVGLEPGPDWATDINNSLTIVDQHNHTSNSGVQIPPAGLNINADLPFNDNNLIDARSLRMYAQSVALNLGSDLRCLYVITNDLYYIDGLGNNIRITQSGGVVGTPGSISNLTSPASASYVSANQTFVWQSAANTAANMDAASFTLRNTTTSSKGLTLNPPNAMGADYSLVLPSLPASQKIMTLDASGNMAAPYVVDNTTIQVSANTIGINPAYTTLVNPPGIMTMFGGTSAPTGWLMCDGAAVSRTTYAALFAVVGTAFGSGDGSTTFNIPDSRGYYPRGVDGSAGRDPDEGSRTAMNSGGNTGNNVGSVQQDAYKNHFHNINQAPSSGSYGGVVANQSFGAGPTTQLANTALDGTSTETRGKNFYINFIIKT